MYIVTISGQSIEIDFCKHQYRRISRKPDAELLLRRSPNALGVVRLLLHQGYRKN